ncbi:MAG: T9SS type A sorting domain-containing protein [Bacteroidales bacterium]|nr:T9SS type A sorting domain-containing protein [Bacteroidales bacterium]
MKKKLNFILWFNAFLIFVVGIETLSAQTWEPTNGPYGERVQCFIENSSYIFIGTGGGYYAHGIYRSADDGLSWSSCNNGLSTVNMGLDVPTMGSSGNYLLAAAGFKVYRSDNNGDTWIQTNYNDTYVPTVFVNDGSYLYGAGNMGLYVSTDNGLNWISKNNNIPGFSSQNPAPIQSLVVSGSYLYASTNNHGIFRSADHGETWTTVNTGLGNAYEIAHRNFKKLVVAGDDVFVVAEGTGVYPITFAGVFRLANNGNTWTNESTGLPVNFWNGLMVKDNLIYCGGISGIYVSSYSGQLNWSALNSDLPIQNISVLYQGFTDVYTAGEMQIYRSTDNLSTWTAVYDQLPGYHSNMITNIGDDVYAEMNSHLFHTSDFGENWTSLNMGTLSAGPWEHGNYLFCSYQYSDFYRSSDGGLTWTELPEFVNLTWEAPSTFLSKGDTIFAGGGFQGDAYGIFYSLDNGETWSQTAGCYVAPGSINQVGNTMYAGTVNGSFISTDNGLNWSPCFPLNPGISLFFNGSDIYSTGGGVFHSSDNGAHWSNISIPDRTHSKLVFNGDEVYTATLEQIGSEFIPGGIYKSTDQGAHWTEFNEGFESLPYATSLAVAGNYLFANNFFTGAAAYRRALSGDAPSEPDPIVGNESPCIGSTQIYSVTNVPEVNYTWEVPQDWIITAGQNTNSITVTVGTFTGWVKVTPSNGWGNGPARLLTVTPTLTADASISIEAGQNNVCQGSPVVITATPSEGGDSPVYQWFVNDVENGETGPVLTYIPTNNDEVYALLTSSLECVVNDPVQSNIIQIQVSEPIEVTVTIDVDKNDVCAGDVMTFTATTTNGGDQPEYSWYLNEAATGENAPTFAYTPENGDIVSLVLTSSEWCVSQNPVTSNAIVAIVNPLPEVSWNYTDPTTVCIEDWGPITLTGGLPEGGVYSGDGVSGNIFDQAVAGAGNHLISYTYTDAEFCSNQTSIEFTVDECLGISESATRLLVYPNPANKNITIKLMDNQAILDITLFDNMGIAVYENHDVKSMGTLIIPVQQVKAGNYIIKVTGNNETLIRSVIIE